MALGYSAMIIIMERNEGLLDRTWVAGMYYEICIRINSQKNCNFFINKCCFFTGVSPGQFALAHFLVSLVVNLLQVIVTLVFTIAVFQVRKIILNEKKIFCDVFFFS